MAFEDRKASLMVYCRIDEFAPGEEELLEVFYASAVDYMRDAGVQEPPEGTERYAKYSVCINALVLTMWDSRGTVFVGQTVSENPAFRRILNQLKMTEPVSESDTGVGN